ncbi:MAG: transposase, partial [Gammaproteobacteria bacterium]|nr:transposase [Gammaproteobacteria bacterium]
SDIAFEQFFQELPEDYDQRAREFKAFCRPRKIKTPAQLMRVVMSYCGLDQVLREVAGTFTLLEEAISDTAIHQRLKACLPWVKALLTQMMGEGMERLIEGNLRLVVIDGSTVQGPGASGTWYRLHIAIDLVKLNLIHVEVTDKYQGERLDYYPLQDGDVVLIDRGYNQPSQLLEQGAKNVCVVLRYNPHGMGLFDDHGQKIDWSQQLKDCSGDNCCVPARVAHEGQYLEGWVHASRLPEEQAAQARRRVRANAKKKGRTAQAKTLLMAGWVLVFTTVAPEILSTTVIAALYRVRWQVELVIKRLKSLLDVDQLRAREGSALASL